MEIVVPAVGALLLVVSLPTMVGSYVVISILVGAIVVILSVVVTVGARVVGDADARLVGDAEEGAIDVGDSVLGAIDVGAALVLIPPKMESK